MDDRLCCCCCCCWTLFDAIMGSKVVFTVSLVILYSWLLLVNTLHYVRVLLEVIVLLVETKMTSNDYLSLDYLGFTKVARNERLVTDHLPQIRGYTRPMGY